MSGIADHWAEGDVYQRILEAMAAAGLSRKGLTIEDLAPVDHFHARGFPATRELADRLDFAPGDRLVDIGCGLGGPARYFADRFGCRVDGVDITGPFVEAGNRLSALVGLEDRVSITLGDGQALPYPDAAFDGAISQHVTMNIADRDAFFAEAARVLKQGARFTITEHGLGTEGDPHHPLPWSEDGGGAYLVTPEESVARLADAGFVYIELRETGAPYLDAYRNAIRLAASGKRPAFGVHILLGETAPEKVVNAARNIEEGRTRPVEILCRSGGGSNQ